MNIKTARLKLGLTQKELAKIMGMTFQSISRLERGERSLTKQQKASLKMVCLINDKGFLKNLIKSSDR